MHVHAQYCHVVVILTILAIVFLPPSSTASNNYLQYTFYYESLIYHLEEQHHRSRSATHVEDEANYNVSDTSSTASRNDNRQSDATSFELQINEDISVHILKSSSKPFIIEIMNQRNESQLLSLSYDDYEHFNSIDIWNTPDRHRRRLRTCSRRHCRWWSCHRDHYWCKPIAPPDHDPYWLHRWYRAGRFIGMYPSKRAMAHYTYYGCSRYCLRYFGGPASIFSHSEALTANHACYLALVHPGARNQRDYAGNWRGHSCYIGLTRPFKQWDDKRKVTFTYWYPGEPNNWGHWIGHHEDCTEAYIWHSGRWNDLACHAKRSCICQDPRGMIEGPYVGAQAMRPYKEAQTYCKQHYGTELATILSEEDNQHARKLCSRLAFPHSAPHCWIGLQRPFAEWDDGSNAEEKFENWYPGEPNNKNEKCTELYAEHRGLWNDLHCSVGRYILCNAQNKIQRMDFHEREEMIAKRMARHKMRWEKYQQQEYRRKIRKKFFEQMKAQRAMMRKQARERQQRMREYYRQMAFQRQMSKVGQQSSNMMLGNMRMFGATRAFADDSMLQGNTYEKRRRLRDWLEQNSQSIARQKRLRAESVQKKMKKQQQTMKEKKALRETDPDAMFYEADELQDITDAQLREVEENVNPSPKRCVLVSSQRHLFELCLDDETVEVINYLHKTLRFADGDDEEAEIDVAVDMTVVDIEEDSHYVSNYTVADYHPMGMQEYERFRYNHAMLHDKLVANASTRNQVKMRKTENVQVMRSNEFIYDYEKQHKKQCYNVEKSYHNKICLEFNEVTNTMMLYIDEDDYFANFEDDTQWNEVTLVRWMDAEEEKKRIKKCLTHFDIHVCVVKKLTPYKYFNEHLNDNGYLEYRVVVTQQSDDHETPIEDQHVPQAGVYDGAYDYH